MNIRELDRSSVNGLSQTITVLLYSILFVVVIWPYSQKVLLGNPIWQNVIGTLLSAVSLSVVWFVVSKLLFTVWARPFLGTWVYHSRNSDGSINHLGLATFKLSGTSIKYKVELYEEPEGIHYSLKNDSRANSHYKATARSVALEKNQDKIDLIYSVEKPQQSKGYEEREGYLRVETFGGGLRGVWNSLREPDDEESDSKSGDLEFLSVEEFYQRHDEELEVTNK